MGIKIPANTLQIQTKAAGRLSPNLTEKGKTYICTVDRKNKKLILDGNKNATGDYPLQVYMQKGGKSGMISLKSVLGHMGLDPEKIRGRLYDVKVDGEKLEVQF